jgi:hypothetical protein
MTTLPDWGEYYLTKEDVQYEYQPFNITGYTDFHPAQTILGETFHFDRELRTTTSIIDHPTGKIQEMPMIYVKFSPLLDPIRFVVGKYDLESQDIRTLATRESPNPPFEKLGSPHNAAYVDSLFCYLSNLLVQKHGFVNGIECYGMSSGVQKKYKMSIVNDLEFFEKSTFFRKHLTNDPKNTKAHFIVPESSMCVLGSSGPTPLKKLHIDDNANVLLDGVEDLYEDLGAEDLGVEDLGAECLDAEVSDTEVLNGAEDLVTKVLDSAEDDFNEVEIDELNDNDAIELLSDSSCKSDVSSRLSVSSEELEEQEEDAEEQAEDEDEDDDEWTDEDASDNSDDLYGEEPEMYMYLRDFPVQMIFMEKFSGTLDELLLNRLLTDETHLSAALMQVIMTLIIYKRAYGFTHNDLHTSNIMYKTTEHEYLYYIFNGKTYRVPTYGRIFTLIDFGRAIYNYKGHVFCSDSFAPDGDAYTQYNTEPFYNPAKPRIDPNPSFDLCRLGCALYDIALDGEYDTRDLNEYQRTVFRWCQDDTGRNILYKSNGDERYPNFKSYKMIARIVHEHTPEAQLEFPFFSQWVFEGDEFVHGPTMNIDVIE